MSQRRNLFCKCNCTTRIQMPMPIAIFGSSVRRRSSDVHGKHLLVSERHVFECLTTVNGRSRHDGKCLEINGTISINNETTFECQCSSGYDGLHCELVSDMCRNITCENHGFCIHSYQSWSCQCLDASLYSGEFCQHESSRLKAKQILSKSFAFIAILAITAVFVFVIVMDVLKYVFNIDPVDRERRLLALKEEKKYTHTLSKRTEHKKVALRFFYIA